MFLRVIKTPYTLSKYILKNPKYNIPKVGFAGWVGYKIFQFAHADASAIETVKNRVLEVALKGAQTDIEDDSQTYHLTPMKQVLVILNPASSGGDAGKYFEQYIEPILMVSGFDITVYKTTGVKDARDHAKSLYADKFETIIVVGGDGTEWVKILTPATSPVIGQFGTFSGKNRKFQHLGPKNGPETLLKPIFWPFFGLFSYRNGPENAP